MSDKQSLFNRIGGSEALEVAVEMFYEKILLDMRIRKFFSGVDMKRLRDHQKLFLTCAFGGISNYKGSTMWEAHSHLVTDMGMTDDHFDIVADHLAQTIDALNVPAPEQAEIMAIVESVRDQVMGRAK